MSLDGVVVMVLVSEAARRVVGWSQLFTTRSRAHSTPMRVISFTTWEVNYDVSIMLATLPYLRLFFLTEQS